MAARGYKAAVLQGGTTREVGGWRAQRAVGASPSGGGGDITTGNDQKRGTELKLVI